MTAKRRVRKQKKANRRNTDVNPHPVVHEVPAPERRSESRRQHPAGKGLDFDFSQATLRSVSLVREGEGFPGSEVHLVEEPVVLDVASLHPEEVRLTPAEFALHYGGLPRRGSKSSVIKALINAEEAVRAEAESDSASSAEPRGSEGVEGQPSAEPEAEPLRRQTASYAEQKALFERYHSRHGKDHVIGGVVYTTEELLRKFEEKPGPEPLHAEYGRDDEFAFPAAGVRRSEPFQLFDEDGKFVGEVTAGDLVDHISALGQVRGSRTVERVTLKHKTHLVHYEKEVNLIPVHAGSATCHCEIGKDHWKELGEN